MVPNSVKVPMPFEYVFPKGVLLLGVEPVKDWDAKGPDDQARDEHGVRVWGVRVMDLDEDAGRFGRRTDVVVKIAAAHQPVPPPSAHEGYPPSVVFDGLTVTPYVDVQGCTGKNTPHRCRARQAWSIRATAMYAPDAAASSAVAA